MWLYSLGLSTVQQVYAQGAGAHAKGIEVNMRLSGFRLEDVKFRGIRFWYGEDDVNTTPTMGCYMADRLPGPSYKEYPKKSCLTIWDEEALEDVLKHLISQGPCAENS